MIFSAQLILSWLANEAMLTMKQFHHKRDALGDDSKMTKGITRIRRLSVCFKYGEISM
jgi:hypothetical protein